ncbi:unnamed protein product, partial [Brassica oleracea]
KKTPPRDQTGFEIDQSRFSNSPSGESLEYLALLSLSIQICVRSCCQRQQEVDDDHTQA